METDKYQKKKPYGYQEATCGGGGINKEFGINI